jgi:hypothetical protein
VATDDLTFFRITAILNAGRYFPLLLDINGAATSPGRLVFFDPLMLVLKHCHDRIQSSINLRQARLRTKSTFWSRTWTPPTTHPAAKHCSDGLSSSDVENKNRKLAADHNCLKRDRDYHWIKRKTMRRTE